MSCNVHRIDMELTQAQRPNEYIDDGRCTSGTLVPMQPKCYETCLTINGTLRRHVLETWL